MDQVSSREYGLDQLVRQVKLVIWDLDDTFWQGTLSEGPVVQIPANIDMIKELAHRGIISSICSKNDMEAVQATLIACGAWDYFVFPKVDYTAKGARIAALIEEMNLRPDNVLFIDDNIMNLREVVFAAPGIMAVDPAMVLDDLLQNEYLRGKPDHDLHRLNQYKQLQQKSIAQSTGTLSNEGFLRTCDIKVNFSYDLAPQIDRIVDLINRSNQLNFTKKRISPDGQDAFAQHLQDRDVYAATVSAKDVYGDYGVVGFFLLIKDPVKPVLEHFVFSCRTMHMGIEQYVYEHIGSPPITVIGPVSNDIVAFDAVDWITEGDAGETAAPALAAGNLVLVGGCDLLQVSSYLSKDRIEFVNDVRDGVVIRYDDFGFVLNDRDLLQSSAVMRHIPCWTSAEALAFDSALQHSDVVVISLWVAFRGHYLTTRDGLALRVHPYGLGEYLDRRAGKAFQDQVSFYKLSPAQSGKLLEQAIARIVAMSPGARHVLIGANTRVIDPKTPGEDRAQRAEHNKICRRLGELYAGIDYIDIDTLIAQDQMVDEWHYTRLGYLQVAQEIKRRLGQNAVEQGNVLEPTTASVVDMVREGTAVSARSRFGPPPPKLRRRVTRLLARSQAGARALHVAKSYFQRIRRVAGA